MSATANQAAVIWRFLAIPLVLYGTVKFLLGSLRAADILMRSDQPFSVSGFGWLQIMSFFLPYLVIAFVGVTMFRNAERLGRLMTRGLPE